MLVIQYQQLVSYEYNNQIKCALSRHNKQDMNINVTAQQVTLTLTYLYCINTKR